MAEKEAEVERWSAHAIYSYVETERGGQVVTRQRRRGVPSGYQHGVDDFDWPNTLPVFRAGETIVSPFGEVWIHRVMPAGGNGRVEVFDEEGLPLGFVELPPRSNVIDFGANTDLGVTIYVTRIDDVGLVWLELYRVQKT